MNEFDEHFQSVDFDEAERQLNAWIASRDVRRISDGLGHQSVVIRKQAAQALGKIGDATSVAQLAKALERSLEVRRGGTETEVLQNELRAILVNALRQLTGLDFERIDPASESDMRQVIDMSRAWSMNYQP